MTGGGGLKFPHFPAPHSQERLWPQILKWLSSHCFSIWGKTKTNHYRMWIILCKAKAVFSQNPNCCHGPHHFLLMQSGLPVTWEWGWMNTCWQGHPPAQARPWATLDPVGVLTVAGRREGGRQEEASSPGEVMQGWVRKRGFAPG